MQVAQSNSHTLSLRAVSDSRRERVYIFCEKDAGDTDLTERMRHGVMAKAFPAVYPDEMTELDVLPDPYENSTQFGVGRKVSQFKNAGVMQGCHVLTCDFAEDYRGERRLVPDELDQLQGFPKGWTDTGMTDGHRAFCMGNALVTGVPHRIGEAMVEVYSL